MYFIVISNVCPIAFLVTFIINIGSVIGNLNGKKQKNVSTYIGSTSKIRPSGTGVLDMPNQRDSLA